MIKKLNTSWLSQRCEEEQRLFIDSLPHDPRYCYELFRRALQNRDELAWEYVVAIFSPLVKSWVVKHEGFPGCEVGENDIVQSAFARFLPAISGKGFDSSKNLAALLNYLKRCVHSEIVDLLRRNSLPTVPLPDDLPGTVPAQVEIDPIAVKNLWTFVHSTLKDEKERIVVYATFFLDYKPNQICTAYPANFKSVQDVYRIKEKVIARLRRADGFKEHFDYAV